MANEVRWRNGTAAQRAAFTGALAEVTVNTDKKALQLHDGSTASGNRTLMQPRAWHRLAGHPDALARLP